MKERKVPAIKELVAVYKVNTREEALKLFDEYAEKNAKLENEFFQSTAEGFKLNEKDEDYAYYLVSFEIFRKYTDDALESITRKDSDD